MFAHYAALLLQVATDETSPGPLQLSAMVLETASLCFMFNVLVTESDDAFEQQGIDLAWVVVQRDKQLGWNLLNSPHQLQILTIDAFSARLTTSMPWLSCLGDKPRTTDNAQKHYAAV